MGEHREPVETGEYTDPVLQPLGKLRDLTFKSGEKNYGEKSGNEKSGPEKSSVEKSSIEKHVGQ
jgi:hypothetical protein